MKLVNFIIFFSIVLTINYSINYYIIIRGLDVLPINSSFRTFFVIAVLFFASAYIIGRVIELIAVNPFSTLLIWIGAFWMAIMVYIFLQLVAIDLLRALNFFTGFFPAFIKSNYQQTKEVTALVVLAVTFITVFFGFINTLFPVIKNYEFNIAKQRGKLNELNIVMVSDIHLGTINGNKFLSNVVDKINALEPDIILIPGDIIDEDIASVIENNVGDELKRLDAKYGIYAVTGNHEYIGGVAAAKKYLHEHNINLLNDEARLIDNSFYIAGREDLSIKQFTGSRRKPLSEIVKDVDKSYPVILLDHQPFKLNQAVENGIDLQLSGHTHHGQLWPFNFITQAVYELSYGYKQKGSSHFYVSCGVGGWGPPVRTGSRPEIVKIFIKFNS
ncbi:putative metallophosphoesterase [bacterium BMS3Abin03]|nr:putative metallophosphoesterase [bacterium BMS3Abin03]